MKAIAILFACLFLAAGAAFPQFPPSSRGIDRGFGQTVNLRGSIIHNAGTPIGNLMVELYDLNGRAGKAMVSPDGSFDFSSVTPGQYEVRVTDIHGNAITEQTVWARDGVEGLQIRLPESQGEKPVSGTVSLAELMHKVPSKARKESALAEKAWKKHDLQACAEHLQKAVEIDPEFLAARSDLGLIYAHMNQPDKVISTFQEVLKIDPRSAFAYSLIAAARVSEEKFADAEFAARRALQIDSTSLRSKYVLGVSLAKQGKNDTEALKYLHESEEAFPISRMVAANILARHGRVDEAREELERYLPAASGTDKDAVKSWIARLK